jgi:hypothetical protein
MPLSTTIWNRIIFKNTCASNQIIEFKFKDVVVSRRLGLILTALAFLRAVSMKANF